MSKPVEMKLREWNKYTVKSFPYEGLSIPTTVDIICGIFYFEIILIERIVTKRSGGINVSTYSTRYFIPKP